MKYEKQILQILTDVGQRGISVRVLTKHVYNMNCTFFSQPDLDDIHRQVQQYLYRNSKSKHALIEHIRHGYYRLNKRNQEAVRQLLLDF